MRNPLSIEAFADWCEKQPSCRRYKYEYCCRCAFAQYLEALGLTEVSVDLDFWEGRGVGGLFSRHSLPDGLDDAVREKPRTFGALAMRLRAPQ